MIFIMNKHREGAFRNAETHYTCTLVLEMEGYTVYLMRKGWQKRSSTITCNKTQPVGHSTNQPWHSANLNQTSKPEHILQSSILDAKYCSILKLISSTGENQNTGKP